MQHITRWTLVLSLVCAAWLGVDLQAEQQEEALVDRTCDNAMPTLSLENALCLTLRNDPNIMLQDESVDFQEGVIEESQGQFDWTLRGNLSYRHEERELTAGTKQAEADERADLLQLQAETCEGEVADRQKLIEIDQALVSEDFVPITNEDELTLQLEALSRLIDRATDPEDAAVLRAQRQAVLQRERIRTQQSLEFNSETCAGSTDRLESLGPVPEAEVTENALLDVRLEKRFRNGVLLAPFLEGSYDRRQFVGKRNGEFVPALDPRDGTPIVVDGVPLLTVEEDFGGTNLPSTYTFRLGFDVNIPLLRGRGSDAAGAQEKVAKKDQEAIKLLAVHTAAESALTAAGAYWNLRAAQDREKILGLSVDLQNQLSEITKELVDGGAEIAAQNTRAAASLASAQAQLNAALRQTASARAELLRIMGLPSGSEGVLLAETAFPEFPSDKEIEDLTGSSEIVDSAIEHRNDLLAAKAFLESSRISERASQIDLRSLLDVDAGAWATGVGDDKVSDALDNLTVPSYRIGLSYEKIFRNRARRGRVAQQESLTRQNQISAADLERNVRLAVVETSAALLEARRRLEQAELAEEHFEETISNEIELLKEGSSTLLDAIITQQQQVGSSLARLDAQLEVALLLARLHFETGMLVRDDRSRDGVINESLLTNLPNSAR